ncbi:ANK_REP_REGION domain-containing protein, partial [Caerostris extrusa]
MISKYEEALDIICKCTNVLPTPLVVNKVIFEVIKNCNGEQAHKAAFYLEDALSMTPEDLNFDFKKALEDSTGTFHDIWSVFAHFVKSSLYEHQIGDMKNYSSHMEPIKSPNCDVLVDYYVKVFVSTPIKSLLIQNNFEERFRTLSYWINSLYKYNIENNSSLPIHVLINQEKLADIAFIIISICKNAFANSYNLQRFLSYSQLPYLKIIVCQFRLHELIKGKSLPIVPVPLSLYTIVKDYFMIPQGKKMEIERKHLILKLYIKLNNGIKNKVPGDTDLHRFCRKGKSADLKEILSRGKCPYINVKNSAGRTPLHEACISSNFSCCKILLEETKTNEVDLKATDNDGYTPLHFAVLMNSREIVQYLLTHG